MHTTPGLHFLHVDRKVLARAKSLNPPIHVLAQVRLCLTPLYDWCLGHRAYLAAAVMQNFLGNQARFTM